MKILAINRATQKEAVLEYDTILEAKVRNSYFKEFSEIAEDFEEYESQSYKNIYGDIRNIK